MTPPLPAAVRMLLIGLMAACGPDSEEPEDLPDPGPTPDLAASQLPPSVVLVTVDTLRADHLPWHGYPRNTAPFLNQLRKDSAVFLNARSTSSHTCPSHASIFTGLYPTQHGATVNGSVLDDSLTTMAEILQAEEYSTAAFASVGFLGGLRQGFEVFAFSAKAAQASRRGQDVSLAHIPAEEIFRRVRTWYQDVRQPGPFFLWVHFFDVHEWADVKADPRSLRRLAEGPGREEVQEYLQRQHGLDPAPFEADGLTPYMDMIDRYDAAILTVDATLRRLYKLLHGGPGGNQALWIIAADHGEGLGSHGYLGHGQNLYQEQLHVPLMLHFTDGRFAGSTSDRLVRTIDLLPTVVEYLGTEVQGTPRVMGHPALLGQSLLSLLEADAAEQPDRLAFSERRPRDDERPDWLPEEVYSLQRGELKLIGRSQTEDEFFHLGDNPLELSSLQGPPSAERDALERILARHLDLMRQQAGQVQSGAVDEAHLEELRRLGYIK